MILPPTPVKKALKSIYAILPFKQPVFSVLRKVWRPSPELYRHLHFKGVLTVPVDATHAFKIRHYGFQLENEVFWDGLGGGWEKVSIDLWTKLCRRSQVIFDIGANTGLYALVAKSLRPEAKVYAFEPVQRVFEKLQANNRLNNYDIHCVCAAISDKNGTAVFYDPGEEHVYAVSVNKNLTPDREKMTETQVDIITLDHFAETENLDRIDLLKIDVETHEPEVLQGFSKLLHRHRPALLIEVLNNECAERLQPLLEGMDYRFYNINEKTGPKRIERITKSDHFNLLVCSAETAEALGLS